MSLQSSQQVLAACILMSVTSWTVHGPLASVATAPPPAEPLPVEGAIATDASGVPLVTLAALDRLRDGTFEERLALVEDISPWLDGVIDSRSVQVIEIAAEDLAIWLDQETDDWLRYRLLSNLYSKARAHFMPFFRRALGDRSPNLVRVALDWLETWADPEAVPVLEDLWGRTKRDWLRVALMTALVRQRSRTHVQGFLHFARSAPSEHMEEILEALDSLGDPAALELMIRFSSHRNEEIRHAAIRGLGNSPDSTEAMMVLLELTSDRDVLVQRLATKALAKFHQPAVTNRLLELASDSRSDYLQKAAVEALRGRNHPGIFPLLQGILVPDTDSYLYRAAYGTLKRLADISPDPAIPAFLASVETTSRVVIYSCGGNYISYDVPGLWIAPPDGFSTARCWAIPGRKVLLDPDEQTREDVFMPVEVTGYFETDGELWTEIDDGECWVPASHLVWGTATETIGRLIEHERVKNLVWGLESEANDIPLSELESDTARRLAEAGFLSLFDPVDDVIGAEITVKTDSYEECWALLDTYHTDETYLGRMVSELLSWCDMELDDEDPQYETFFDSWE